jgi:hypothetical protein
MIRGTLLFGYQNKFRAIQPSLAFRYRLFTGGKLRVPTTIYGILVGIAVGVGRSALLATDALIWSHSWTSGSGVVP